LGIAAEEQYASDSGDKPISVTENSIQAREILL
jgi:hypothetical protein